MAANRALTPMETADCRPEAGRWIPVVDRAKCEGKSDCVAVCPYDVFEVRRMDDAAFNALGFFARLKSRLHRRKTAYTPRQDACHGCGLCVSSCPEKAITLRGGRMPPPASPPPGGPDP